MTANERIKLLRKELKMSQEVFAENLGVTRAVIKNIELGIVDLKEHMLILASKVFNVNENWLRTGEGEMFLHEESNLLAELTRTYNLKSKEIAIVKAFLELSEAGRAGVLEYIEKANNNIAQSRQSRAEIIAKDIETTEKILIQSQLKKSSDSTEN